MQDKKYPLAGLNLPAPKSMPKGHISKSLSLVEEDEPVLKWIDTDTVIKECHTAIKLFNLKQLVDRAQKDGYKALKEEEHELLSAGLIKLGEALTFCRNRQTLNTVSIVDVA